MAATNAPRVYTRIRTCTESHDRDCGGTTGRQQLYRVPGQGVGPLVRIYLGEDRRKCTCQETLHGIQRSSNKRRNAGWRKSAEHCPTSVWQRPPSKPAGCRSRMSSPQRRGDPRSRAERADRATPNRSLSQVLSDACQRSSINRNRLSRQVMSWCAAACRQAGGCSPGG